MAAKRNRDILQQVLKTQRVNRVTNEDSAVSKQPAAPTQQAPQQSIQQEQARMFVPVEEESSETQSESESESESGSDLDEDEYGDESV